MGGRFAIADTISAVKWVYDCPSKVAGAKAGGAGRGAAVKREDVEGMRRKSGDTLRRSRS
jgi:hypothetical protein